jgi:DNA-binding response OmpR family regulator
MTTQASGLTVLVADPDSAQLQISVECLRPRYRVLTAGSLAETSDAIARYHPQILLLEWNMPDGDGRGLIRHLRENQATRGMIICCVTTQSNVRDKIAGFQAGADDYVVKPINTKTFMYRVQLLTRVRKLA